VIREPTRLVRVWRRAVAEAAAPFWKEFALHDLRLADAAAHSRLLVAIAALDQACASTRPDAIATAGTALVAGWQDAAALMERRPVKGTARRIRVEKAL
jgi:hypothetical protein